MIHGSDIGEAIRKQRIEHRTRLTKNKERLTKRFWLWRLGNMIWEHCFGDIVLEEKCGLPRRPEGTSICSVKRECRIAEPGPRVSFKDFICGSGHCERAYNMVLTRHDKRIRHATNWAAPSEKVASGTQGAQRDPNRAQRDHNHAAQQAQPPEGRATRERSQDRSDPKQKQTPLVKSRLTPKLEMSHTNNEHSSRALKSLRSTHAYSILCCALCKKGRGPVNDNQSI